MKETIIGFLKNYFITFGVMMVIGYFVQTVGKCTMVSDFDCQRRFTVSKGK